MILLFILLINIISTAAFVRYRCLYKL